MENLFLPMLIAIVVGLVAWGAFQVISTLMDPERRKLKARLSKEAPAAVDSQRPTSITIKEKTVGVSRKLARVGILGYLNRRLLQAMPGVSLARFLIVCASMALMAYGVAAAVVDSLMVQLIAAGIAGYVPFLVLSIRRNRRQIRIALQLPEAMDFLSRILRAGHSLSTGLQMMGEELPQPLGGEFRRAYDQHSLGQTLEDSLKDMATRIESTDFAFFVTAVLIQRQTGGDLSEVLSNISGMVRSRIRLQQHVKAKTAEGRFTGYILVAFPVFMFVVVQVMNPTYGRVLLYTDTGQWMLVVAFGLSALGLYFIRRITTVKV